MHLLRTITFFYFLAFACASCKNDSPSPASDQTPATNNKYSYLALGDSYTIGQSVPEESQWGVQLARLLQQDGVDVALPVTIARTGWTTSDLISAINSAKLNQTFDLVTLLIGVNNQYRGQSLETYRRELRELLQKGIKFGKNDPDNVILLSIPDWGVTPFAQGRNRQQIAQEIDAFNAVAKEEAQKANVKFIDVTPLTREHGDETAYLANDGIHYSAKMYKEWALLTLPVAEATLQ